MSFRNNQKKVSACFTAYNLVGLSERDKGGGTYFVHEPKALFRRAGCCVQVLWPNAFPTSHGLLLGSWQQLFFPRGAALLWWVRCSPCGWSTPVCPLVSNALKLHEYDCFVFYALLPKLNLNCLNILQLLENQPSKSLEPRPAVNIHFGSLAIEDFV